MSEFGVAEVIATVEVVKMENGNGDMMHFNRCAKCGDIFHQNCLDRPHGHLLIYFHNRRCGKQEDGEGEA